MNASAAGPHFFHVAAVGLTLVVLLPFAVRYRLDKVLSDFICFKRKSGNMSGGSGDLEKVVQQLAKATVADTTADVEVSFAGRGLKLDTTDDAKEIVQKIKECENMTVLRMEGNTVGVDAAKAIAKALESQSQFKKAYWKDMFTGRLKEEIPRALTFLGSGITLASARLTVLDLSDNALGPIGVTGILPLLRSPSCFTLEQLYLNNNGLGTEGGKLLAQSLIDCYKSSQAAGKPLALKVFVCGRNRLEDVGATAMASFFKIVGTLTEVTMPQNGIRHAGISALADGLAANLKLRVVNLNDNIFTSEGAKAFANALESLQNLECVNFGDCLVRTEGAKAIAKALSKGHGKLKEVNLGYNEIDSSGGVAVVEAMQDKANLETLILDGNKFGPDGCDRLQDLVETFGKPEVLSIEDDEGEESDEERDVEYVEEHEEDEEEEDEKAASQTRNDTQEVLTKVTASDFLSSPSIEKLIGLGNNRVSLLMEELEKDVSIDNYISAFIKVSSVIQSDNEEHKKIANECADAFLSRLFQKAAEDGDMYFLTNAILVHLGLIKCEDKSFKPPRDLKGPLTVMQHVVQQSYFDATTKSILQLFLSKPNKAVESTGKIAHTLRSILFQ